MRKDPKKLKAWEKRTNEYAKSWKVRNKKKLAEYSRRAYLKVRNDPVKWRRYLNKSNERAKRYRLQNKKK